MFLLANPFKIKQSDRNQFCTKIIETSAPNSDYYFLVALSTLIVALGLLADNVILVIGGMLVTPLLSPILAIALGIIINEKSVIMRSVRIFSFSVLLALVIALLVGLFSTKSLAANRIINAFQPDLFSFFVAIVAGLAASFAWAKPNLSETLPGIAITVTLIPPLTSIGLAVADQQWAIFGNAVRVFLINVVGIIAASLLVFSLMDFYRAKKKLIAEVKEEAKELKAENKN